MAMWPQKPEILISPELWQIRWQFQRLTWRFRLHPPRRNWPWANATTIMTGNFNKDVLLANRAISGSRSLSQWFRQSSVELDIIENPEFGVGISALSVRVLEMYFRFWRLYRHFRLSVAVALTCENYFQRIHGLTPQICCWNFNEVASAMIAGNLDVS